MGERQFKDQGQPWVNADLKMQAPARKIAPLTGRLVYILVVSPGPGNEETLWEYLLNGHRLIFPESSLMVVPTFSRPGLMDNTDTQAAGGRQECSPRPGQGLQVMAGCFHRPP